MLQGKILVGIYLRKLKIEHLQWMQDYTNRQLHIKQTTIPLNVIRTTTLLSKTMKVTLYISDTAYKTYAMFQGKAIAFERPFI